MRLNTAHAGPPEVDHEFPVEFTDQLADLLGTEVLLPMHFVAPAPAHASTVRVSRVTGTQHVNIRPNLRRAYKDHTHIASCPFLGVGLLCYATCVA